MTLPSDDENMTQEPEEPSSNPLSNSSEAGSDVTGPSLRPFPTRLAQAVETPMKEDNPGKLTVWTRTTRLAASSSSASTPKLSQLRLQGEDRRVLLPQKTVGS